MQCLYRRPSGIYSVRLIVPERLRQVIGKVELVASTGSRDLFVAKVIATAMLAQWRARFSELSPFPLNMDIKQVFLGTPLLSSPGFVTVETASQYSGLDVTELLNYVSNGCLELFYSALGLRGHRLDDEDLIEDAEGPEWTRIVPPQNQMPASALQVSTNEILGISPADHSTLIPQLRAGGKAGVFLFECLDTPGKLFAPDSTCQVQLSDIRLKTHEIEIVRQRLASLITPEQLTHAATASIRPAPFPKSSRRLSAALDHYVTNKLSKAIASVSDLHRIKNGIALLVELDGDPVLSDIDIDRLRRFREETLSKVPANENKIRLMYGTTSVSESIARVAGTDWPVMSASERDKRMMWIGTMFSWLHAQKWISDNPASGIKGEHVMSKVERRRAKDSRREVFTPGDFSLLFGAEFFATGRGNVTATGKHHSFSPFHYWLPLIGALTGARINEICQLDLADIRQTEAGTWYFAFTDECDDSTSAVPAGLEEKRLKNPSSRRLVPMHPKLVELGLLDWVSDLRSADHSRLFPELKHSDDKGYSKVAVKWFSTFKSKRGLPKDIKVFHCFRHTFVNLLPAEMSETDRKRLVGHERGSDVHSKTYLKDSSPDVLAPFMAKISPPFPEVASFDRIDGLKALDDAITRKRYDATSI